MTWRLVDHLVHLIHLNLKKSIQRGSFQSLSGRCRLRICRVCSRVYWDGGCGRVSVYCIDHSLRMVNEWCQWERQAESTWTRRVHCVCRPSSVVHAQNSPSFDHCSSASIGYPPFPLAHIYTAMYVFGVRVCVDVCLCAHRRCQVHHLSTIFSPPGRGFSCHWTLQSYKTLISGPRFQPFMNHKWVNFNNSSIHIISSSFIFNVSCPNPGSILLSKRIMIITDIVYIDIFY